MKVTTRVKNARDEGLGTKFALRIYDNYDLAAKIGR